MGARGRVALVTGAGSGLGAAVARLLVKDGWRVYGTLIDGQSVSDAEAAGFTPIVLDTTSRDSVEAARDFLESDLRSHGIADRGLAALINVAGVGEVAGGIIEGVSEDSIQALFDVNVFGTLRMIQVFLPLLRTFGPARIINVASSGVRIPVPFSGIYAVSKYAVEGITNALRYELKVLGIQVTSIEPGAMVTPMTAGSEEASARTWARMPQEVRDIYYEKLSPALDSMQAMIGAASDPEDIARAIVKVLRRRRMKIRYTVGKDVAFMPFLQRVLGENMFERLILAGLKL